MKFSVISLILSAGLAISQVSAAPIRVVVVSGHITSSNGFVRVGHAAANLNHPNANVATMHSVNKVHTKAKHGCAGSFRAKAMQVSNWFRHIFGLPAITNETKAGVVSDGMPVLLPVLPVGGQNAPPQLHHQHHAHKHHLANGHTFVQRLTRALMMLGPWEGRAVSFILGCGIGVLVRMFWVLAVIAIRSIRGKKQEEEFLGDEVIFEEDEHLLPPQYAENIESVAKEKSEPFDAERSA
ncbi:hypothetical protein JB92DRAFT_3128572 [Gautieria morchelliformis]|nr:hypothetical protein JB92DRAFT_3128572 [Gautieria morchelliformis]